MAQVYLGLGSNIDPVANLKLAVRELRARFGEIELSAVYRSRPIGFEGADFLNMAVRVTTASSPGDVVGEIEAIHGKARRERDGDKLMPRTLDIDLLLYDRLILDEGEAELPRPDVLDYAFVLRPLSELAPDYLHPVSGRRLRDHWLDFDAASQPLTKVSLGFDG